MFSEKNKNTAEPSKEQNKLSAGTEITGDIKGTGSFRIEGKLEGSLKTNGKVVIGKTGYIKGKLECKNVDIEGRFSGEVKVTDTMTLKSHSEVDGQVETRRLAVDPGAEFNATCVMKEQVKSLKNEQAKKGQQKKQAK